MRLFSVVVVVVVVFPEFPPLLEISQPFFRIDVAVAVSRLLFYGSKVSLHQLIM